MENNGSANSGQQPRTSIPLLMNADDVAEILGIAKKTVHNLVRKGKLGCVQVNDKERKFTKEQVEEYIACRTVPARIDKKVRKPLCSPPKGGAKSVGFSRTSLREEMRSWR